MRKVLFKKWIPLERYTLPADFRIFNVEGTGCMSDFIHEGLFHQFISSYAEYEHGPGYYTHAIVETPDGLVHEMPIARLKFVSNQIPPPPPSAHETNL